MTSPHEQRLSELQQRIGIIDESIAALDTDYADLAVSFESANSRDALKQASSIELKVTELRREKALAIAAQKKVTELQVAEQHEAEAEQRRLALAEAKKHADEIISLHGQIDGTLATLFDLFARRANALRQLGQTGVVGWDLVNKLAGKSGSAAAACHAGLHRFIPIETPAPSSLRPLASANPILQGIGKEHGQERVRLNGGGGT